MFEKYLASMKLREIVSLEDKELLKQMLEELTCRRKNRGS